MTSIQATYAGAIAQVRHAFGAQPDLTARQGVNPITDDQITSATDLASLGAFEPSQSGNLALENFAENSLLPPIRRAISGRSLCAADRLCCLPHPHRWGLSLPTGT